MISINDKKDSIAKMKELNLNYFPLDFFSVKDVKGIENFLKQYPSDEYVLRNPNVPDGDFFYVKDMEEIKQKLKFFEDEVTIGVSYNKYKDDLVLVGDIKVSGDYVDLTARDDCDATQRNIYDNPKYNLHASMDEDKLWDIPGISKIMKYISDHGLYNVIVEFSVYSIKLGVQNENVIISELRTGY